MLNVDFDFGPHKLINLQAGQKQSALKDFLEYLPRISALDLKFSDFESTARRFLGIEAEVGLIKQLHKIIDEIWMMAGIFGQHEQVVGDFQKHLQGIYEYESGYPFTTTRGSDMALMQLLSDLQLESVLQSQDDTKGGQGPKKQARISPIIQTDPEEPITVPESAVRHAESVSNDIILRQIRSSEKATRRMRYVLIHNPRCFIFRTGNQELPIHQLRKAAVEFCLKFSVSASIFKLHSSI